MANIVILTGRMTKDADLRYTNTQVAVARFTLALDRGKDKDGKDKGADFPGCIAFGKTAEFIDKYAGKGNRISVVGHLQTGSYDKDGQKVYTTDIIVDKVEPIDWKGGNETKSTDTDIPEGFSALEDEDLPF